jgi:ubiquitin C-terminal hydrolase
VTSYFEAFHETSAEHPLTRRVRATPLGQFYCLFCLVYCEDRREFFEMASGLLGAVRRETDQFTSGEHHDCHELLIFLIDSFDRSIATLNKKYGMATFQKFSPLFECKRTVYFEGNSCQHSDECTEADSSFYLALEEPSKDDFQTRIDKLSTPEILNGEERWRCEKCQEDVDATRSVIYNELPPICVVQLQRFKYIQKSQIVSKVRTPITIPTAMTLRKGEETLEYDLKTIVVHLGTGIEEGHYVALLRMYERWILADDNKLSLMSDAKFRIYTGSRKSSKCENPVPYVLFYERE